MRRKPRIVRAVAVAAAGSALPAAVVWRAVALLEPGNFGIVMPAATVVFLVVLSLGAFAFLRVARSHIRDEGAVLAEGIAGTARVVEIRYWSGGTAAVAAVTLDVALAGRAPYAAKVDVLWPRANPPPLLPGMTIAVRADPDDARRIAIDWDAAAPRMAPSAVPASTIVRALGDQPHG